MTNIYSGAELTHNLEHFGFPRQEAETDWEYRKRVFPQLYLREGFTIAVSFLMGCSVTELGSEEKFILACLPHEPQKMNGRAQKWFLLRLKNFARGFYQDPVEIRRQKRVAEIKNC